MSNVASADVASAPAASIPRRIALFGERSLFQDALKCLLETRLPGSTIMPAGDDASLLASAADVIVIDVNCDVITEAALAEVTVTVQKVAGKPVLVISDGVQPAVLQQLLRQGVAGVVSRSSSAATLVEAIESVASGNVWLQRDLLAETIGDTSHVRRRVCSQAERIEQLTQREREIIAAISSGGTNRQVAAKLFISEATVRHHLSSIFAKLGVANRGELIIFAYRHSLTDESDRIRLC
jgi:two-component system nitrate/nitrite response regulator NarL